MRSTTLSCLLLATLTSSVAFAQRAGGGRSGAPSGGGHASPQQSAEEASRAANAKQWSDAIEKVRASSPPPPVKLLQFPSENEKLLSRLRWAENPRVELTQYLDKLWKDAKEAPAQRVAVETLWRDAEKPKWVPKWVRPAIEEFFRQRSSGLTLRSTDETAAVLAKPPTTPSAAPPATPSATPSATP